MGRSAARWGVIALALATVMVPHIVYPFRWFNADFALTGLAALDILDGNLPVFLWGQAYMGTLSAYLAVPLIAIFGHDLRVLNAVPQLLTVATFWAFFGVVSRHYGRRLAWPALLSCIWIPDALGARYFYTNPNIPGTVLLGLLLLWLAYDWQPSVRRSFLAGLLIGVMLWLWLTSIVFVATFLILIAAQHGPRWSNLRRWRPPWKLLISPFLGFLVGYAPTFLYAFQDPVAPEMATEAFGIVSIRHLNRPFRVFHEIVTTKYFPLETSTGWAWWVALLGAIVFYGTLAAAAWYLFRSLWRRRWQHIVRDPLLLLLVIQLAVFLPHRRVVDASCERYIPFFYMTVLFFTVRFGRLALRYCAAHWGAAFRQIALVCLVLPFAANAMLTQQSMLATRTTHPRPYDAIVAMLDAQGITRAFSSNYWVTYDVTYLTRSRVILSPLHDCCWVRNEHHIDAVKAAEKIAWFATSHEANDRVTLEGQHYRVLERLTLPDASGELPSAVHILARTGPSGNARIR